MEFAVGALCLGIAWGYPKIGALVCGTVVCSIAIYRIRHWNPDK